MSSLDCGSGAAAFPDSMQRQAAVDCGSKTAAFPEKRELRSRTP